MCFALATVDLFGRLDFVDVGDFGLVDEFESFCCCDRVVLFEVVGDGQDVGIVFVGDDFWSKLLLKFTMSCNSLFIGFTSNLGGVSAVSDHDNLFDSARIVVLLSILLEDR